MDKELLPLIYSRLEALVFANTRKAVKAALEEQKQNASDDEFLTAAEAAEYLKYTLNTVYSKVESGELPHHKPGKRKLLFCKEELREYVRSSKIKSNKEVQKEADNHINGGR